MMLLAAKGKNNLTISIFSFRSHRTLKPRSKFILKIFFVQFKTINGRKLWFNTPLRASFFLLKRQTGP